MNATTDLDGSTHLGSSRRVSRVLRQLLARWPSALGLLALLANLANGADAHVTAMIIIIAATCYLGAAVLGSRQSVWAMVGVVSVAVVLARLAGLDPTVTVIVMGVGLSIFGLVRSSGSARRAIAVQALGFLCYTALGLAAMMAAPTAGIYLAAAAAIGHTAWDVVHHIRSTVVSRSLAEACIVLDLGLAAALLASAWSVAPA